MIIVKTDEMSLEVSVCNEGTEKQIKFANDIKKESFGQIVARGKGFCEKYAELIEKLNAKLSSKFWIENRDSLATDLLKQIREEN